MISKNIYLNLNKILIVFTPLLFLLGVFSNNVLFITWIIFIQTILFCVYAYNNLERHILFFLFMIAFSLFDMGIFYSHLLDFSEWWRTIKGSMTDYNYNKDSIIQTLIIIYVSLYTIFLGYYCSAKFRIKGKHNKDYIENKFIMLYMRRILLSLLYITFVGNMVHHVYRIYCVFRFSYVYLYTGYSEIWILSIMSLIFNISYFCFLATQPNRIETKIPTVMFLSCSFISILTGSRSNAITSLFFVLYYYFVRSNNNEKWINKKWIRFFAIVAPIVFAGLGVISTLRSNNDINGNIMFYIFKFINGQGESGLLITETISNGNKFSYMNKSYTFGGVIRYFQNSSFFCDIFGLKNLTGITSQSETNALYGNSFGCAVSYYKMKYTFLNGYNLGSCYLAELWYDFKWLGVIFGNLLLGFFINKISQIQKNSFVKNCVLLCLVTNLFSLGRASCMSLVTYFLSSTVLCIYFIVFSIYFAKKRRMGI